MNVYEEAHSLAKAIKESEEYKQYEQSKKLVEGNPQLSASIKDLMKKQMEIQASQMMGNQISPETFQQLQQLSAILMQDPSAAQYLPVSYTHLAGSVEFVRSKGEYLDPDTVDALNYLKEKQNL